MRFDRYTVILLTLRPDAPVMTEEEAADLQDRHLAHGADLQDRGLILARGPLTEQDDERLRGFSIWSVDAPTARELAEADPAVRAGRLAGRSHDVDDARRQHPVLPGPCAQVDGRGSSRLSPHDVGRLSSAPADHSALIEVIGKPALPSYGFQEASTAFRRHPRPGGYRCEYGQEPAG